MKLLTGTVSLSRRQKWVWLAIAFFYLTVIAFYLGTYIVFSMHGRYLGHNQGGQDNRGTWAPAYCAELYTSPSGRQKLRLTAIGWCFLPPMLIDQWLIHPTRFE